MSAVGILTNTLGLTGKFAGEGIKLGGRVIGLAAGAIVSIGSGIWSIIDGASKLKNGSDAAMKVSEIVNQLKDCLAEAVQILRHSGYRVAGKALVLALQSSKEPVNHQRWSRCRGSDRIELLVSLALAARLDGKHKMSSHRVGDHVINYGVLGLCDKAIRKALPYFGHQGSML